MALTRDFKETVLARAQRDATFRRAMLKGGVELMLTGVPEDMAVGREKLRTYINATLGFEALAERVEKSPKSLMRMFGRSGNPSVSNLSAVIGELQRYEGIRLGIKELRA